MLADILGEEAQHDIAVVLQQRVLAPVAAIDYGVGQMLRSIDFHRHPRLRREQIDLHSPTPVERNRHIDVEMKLPGSVGKRLQPPVEEGFAGATRPLNALRPRLKRARREHEPTWHMGPGSNYLHPHAAQVLVPPFNLSLASFPPFVGMLDVTPASDL